MKNVPAAGWYFTAVTVSQNALTKTPRKAVPPKDKVLNRNVMAQKTNNKPGSDSVNRYPLVNWRC